MSQTWIEYENTCCVSLRTTYENMRFWMESVCREVPRAMEGEESGTRHRCLLAGQSRRRNKFPTARNHQILGRRRTEKRRRWKNGKKETTKYLPVPPLTELLAARGSISQRRGNFKYEKQNAIKTTRRIETNKGREDACPFYLSIWRWRRSTQGTR